jgi:TetR/AcrR family transcriptional regulator, mexJK operon transcriptional repressor
MKKTGVLAERKRERLNAERLAELLDVATEVFLEQGFDAASTREIARRANASKTTFYARFPSKEDLFLAVVERRMATVFEQVARFPETESIEDTLYEFGSGMLKIALSPEQIALIRLVNAEAERYPHLALHFYENGAKRGEDALARFFAMQIRKGRLRRGRPLTMARQFMSLITGSPVRWFVLGFNPASLSKRALEVHLQESVEFFLNACKAQAPGIN